jgi:transposase-like protein
MASEQFPTTLQEAILFFSNHNNCKRFMVALRWPDGRVQCPLCGSEHVSYLEKARLWKCYSKHERPKFSLKTGTIFEDSPIGLEKWLPVMWMLVNAKNGISSWEIHRGMGVTQKTAWFMLQRARLAMQGISGGKLGGEIEVDESFIGGRARNMHASQKERKGIRNGGTNGKTIEMGILERGGEVRAGVVADRLTETLQNAVKQNVEPGASVYTDELRSYFGLDEHFAHKVINHAEKYVDGEIHTNGLENFWSLLD